MLRKLLVAVGALFLGVLPGISWNRAGHMVTGAIAYDELLRTAPATASRVVAILRQHPQYDSRWKPQLEALPAGTSEHDRERFLFMLAARWPDDIRGDSTFDHPVWHYIDYPYKPKSQPPSVQAQAPKGENIVAAFKQNVAIVQSVAADPEKAVALSWIFHLMGDSHQPLHTVSLFTTEFPTGDQGGNLFFIRPDPSSTETRNLHSYWDGILLTDERYEPARALAAALEATGQQRLPSKVPAELRFERWTHQSFDLAVSTVYRNGALKISTDKNQGTALPRDYHDAAVRLATRRVTLAGDRIADFLTSNFP